MKKTALSHKNVARLEDIPNVGPATAKDLRRLGITEPRHLKGRNGFHLYDQLCKQTKIRHDPCVIDVFLSAIHFMEGRRPKPWWEFSLRRKKQLEIQLKKGFL